MVEKDEAIEVGTIEVKVVPSMGAPEKATLLVVEPKKLYFPTLFEKCLFLHPQLSSPVLEKYHEKISMQQSLRIFQFALGYVALSCLVWCIYFGLQPRYSNSWIYFIVGLLVLLSATMIVFLLSCTKIYERHRLSLSLFVDLMLCASSLLYYVFATGADMSMVGIFVGCIEIIILIYLFIPLPLLICFVISVCYTFLFEIFSFVLTPMSGWRFIVARMSLHGAAHILGMHLYITSQLRQRSTFMKVGQSLKSRRDLQVEKQFKQDMIHSLMPPKVAQEVMSSRDTKGNNEEGGSKRMPVNEDGGQMTFRTFHMSKMENVSILFADIVGFTKMSSNKSAEHLVSLLSDLFGRFDDICCKCGCEKISTLGDCYYCVSGCPEPRQDHARCCVEMGLSMCIAIKQFDEDHDEEVNMRVGVHTGTVLCGLVGTRRFKFDVWSHDVTIANMMESEGRPGCVHISDPTYRFVENDYDVEKGESVPDIRGHKTLIECFDSGTQQYIVQHVAKESTIDTWFVLGRKPHVVPFVPDAHLQVPRSTLEAQRNEATTTTTTIDAITKQQKEEEGGGDKKQPSSGGNLLASSSNSEDLNDAALATSIKRVSYQGFRARQVRDREMIACMESCSGGELQTYLYRPPINRFTLNYHDPSLEAKYRRHCREDAIQLAAKAEEEEDPTEKYNFPDDTLLPNSNYLDMGVALIFIFFVSVAILLALDVSTPSYIVLLLVFGFELLLLACAFHEAHPGVKYGSGFFQFLNRAFLHWCPRHIVHTFVAAFPAAVVFSTFSCRPTVVAATDPSGSFPYDLSELFFCMAAVVSLLHFCNFTILSSWFKFIAVGCIAVIFLLLVHLSVCTMDSSEGISSLSEAWSLLDANGSVYDGETSPSSLIATTAAMVGSSGPGNVTLSGNVTLPCSLFAWVDRPPTVAYEIILVVLLLLLLIALINYDLEVGYRLCFHGGVQVAKDQQKILKEKEQADWLLHIIVPEHVADQLKHKRHYCENHKDVGVIFAKISNFDDFYDESYEGGKEYLRVLNELMGDLEELFDQREYKDVEKIKTIGSCLMAASGLDPRTRGMNMDPDAHLHALMDFAQEIVKKVATFNQNIFNFNFELKIGFNAGEVTAGVIGTEKLLYDIWGDTVNIASRMYSTGVHDCIQVTEALAKRLERKFNFKYRGQTYVKGKGDMNTYLLVGRKKAVDWI